ncbi:MAG: dihydroxyacetone kinase subunit L [Rhizobiales bacterium]|nr:dihydroxyacetone kinase subunit L [Hyphomicrobiales bacterium]
MTSITGNDLVTTFQAIADAIASEKERLSRLDGTIGDGDHGVTMDTGFQAVVRALGQLSPGSADPTTVFNAAAKSFLNAVGASAGPLYATAFMRAGAACKGKATLDRDGTVAALSAMARGIQDRGKAERGEKTMLDVWLPAAEAAELARAQGGGLGECLRSAVEAANAGAEATKGMIAAKGRASRLGERSLGHMDPGAASAAIVLEAMSARLGAAGRE